MPLDAQDRHCAGVYASALGVKARIAVVPGWREAEQVTRDPHSADGWWQQEEAERRALMREVAARIGEALLLQTLTAAVEGHAEHTHACARQAGGDETMTKVASGAALMALHNRSLALLAGRGAGHVFVQKYALFESGRWPLGLRASTLSLF